MFRPICTMSGSSDHTAPEQDPYLLTLRHEILPLFRSMRDKGLLIQMTGRRHGASTVTTLLHMDTATDRLVFDSAPQAAVNQKLLDEGRAVFDVLVEQVKVQFVGEPLRAAVFEGRPALSAPVPSSVRRIQRRDSYRVLVPVGNPATCILALRPASVTLVVHDISATGLALLLSPHDIALPAGTLLRNALLQLPGVGHVQADLQVVREEAREMAGGKRVRLAGATFVALPGRGQNLLQTYIFGLERQMIARQRGLI